MKENIYHEPDIQLDCKNRTSLDLNDIKGYLKIKFSLFNRFLMDGKEKTIYFGKHKVFSDDVS